jgi:glycosyltransferase involved in cell wall biosynthesis
VPGSIHRCIVRCLGPYVAIEYKHRVLRLPKTVTNLLAEHWEVARARRTLGSRPRALVATVIPTFRRPELLARAVESALGQTIEDHVILVVDDGGSVPLPLPSDRRVHVVRLTKNRRTLGVVRNVGIRSSRSRYLAFLDDDNLWEQDHLALSLDAMSRGAGMTYTAVRRVDTRGRPVDILSKPFDRGALRSSNYVDANSIVVRRRRRSMWSRMPRYQGDVTQDDWEFVRRLSRRLPVTHVPVPTVRYLINPDSFFTRESQGRYRPDSSHSRVD